MADLILRLKGEYFDHIRAGRKPEEYRLCTDYWSKRLIGRSYDRVVLTRGYPKGGGVEGVSRLTRQWRGFAYRSLQHKHFGPEPVRVFAIDVSTPEAGESV
jgi:hypothetical protein